LEAVAYGTVPRPSFSRSSCCSPAVDTLAASTPKRVMFYGWVGMSQYHSAHNLPPGEAVNEAVKEELV
jgi:hypothetical protein